MSNALFCLQSIIDCMTATHLPSTLVKCLYLFFDLPTHEADPAYTVSDEEKDMLQKVFVQVKSFGFGHHKKLL